MDVLTFKSANCKNCYKCVRVCPVKSIEIKDEQAQIIPKDCILCGHCIEACTQNAKTVVSDVEKVKGFLCSGAKVIVSLAPSFLGSFSFKKPAQMVVALKKLGFYEVRETAEGAAYVTQEYYKTIQAGKMDVILSTCCPTVNDLIEKYYPDLVKYMAPTVSPMIAHGMTIKQEYGKDVKVVFIGPCISKKREAADIRHEGYVDAVLTFDELEAWFESEDIVVEECGEEPFAGKNPSLARLYPITEGILSNLRRKQVTKETISVDGIKQCKDLFEAMRDGLISNCFIEMNACTGGCIHGPAATGKDSNRFAALLDIKKYGGNGEYPEFESSLSFQKKFFDNSHAHEMPTEAEIRGILKRIGKETPDQELNCGFCGYASCREKAIAVYQKKAHLYMCLPYMSEKAQSLSNVILEETPNMILVADRDLKIQEFNAACERVFGISRSDAMNKYLYEIIDTSDFEFVLESQETIHDKKVSYPQYNITTEQTITYLPSQQNVMAIFRDITAEEQREEKVYKIKVDTMEMAQKVIDKQMVAAQQIASLLGETTAETKVTLTKLKDMIIYDGE